MIFWNVLIFKKIINYKKCQEKMGHCVVSNSKMSIFSQGQENQEITPTYRRYAEACILYVAQVILKICAACPAIAESDGGRLRKRAIPHYAIWHNCIWMETN